MARLTEEQKEKIRTLHKEGKNNKEISEAFKLLYGKEVAANVIWYTCRKGGHKKTKKQKQQGQDIVGEIVGLLRQVESGYKQVFLYLRGELLRSRGQVHEMLKNAKIEIKEEGETEE